VDPDKRPSFISIARIARTRGNRGEVLADLHTDFPDRFSTLEEVWLEFADGRRISIKIEEAWEHKGRMVLKFAGVENISAAEAFVGSWVQLPYSQAMELPEGTYFDHDLIGCSVELAGGERLGIVEDILRIEENNQLVVKGPGGEYLIPAVGSICTRIEIGEKRIVVDPPEGLLDLGK
jgi:16S rRNA processing protein RimM